MTTVAGTGERAIVMYDETTTTTISETETETEMTIGNTGIGMDGTVTTTTTIGVDIETETGNADAETGHQARLTARELDLGSVLHLYIVCQRCRIPRASLLTL